jgi:oxygen-independent coproporphyrinogen-3 oxidase
MTSRSIYIHIPFCLRKCRYCDFYSVPDCNNSAGFIDRYINAIIKEWGFYEDSRMLDGACIDTLYIGGGTPSILGVDVWKRLDDMLFARIDKAGIKEWSVECNPESFTIEKARAYADSGVTRLTFGVQSLNPKELSLCGRAHSAEKALEVLSDGCLPKLFKSIGVDIIYGLPKQTANTLNATLSSLLSIPTIKHLSAYELTIAENTPFGRHSKILPLPSDETIVEMYELINKHCVERGMNHYEISNHALPGFESTHNKAYWSHKPYIGLGTSAHSYIHPKRWSNIADVERYISLVSTNKPARDFEETLSPAELSTEIIFLGLRNADGINEDDFANRTGFDLCADGRGERLQRYVEQGFINKSDKKWIPTSKGMLFADMMARELDVNAADCKGLPAQNSEEPKKREAGNPF